MKATAEEYAKIAAEDAVTTTLAAARAATMAPAVIAIVATTADKQKPQLYQ
jgi:hypothetical protein